MAKIKSVALTSDQRAVLEKASRHGKSPEVPDDLAQSRQAHVQRGSPASRMLRSRGQLLDEALPGAGLCGAENQSRARTAADPRHKDRPGRRAPSGAAKSPASISAKAELQQQLGKEFSTQTLTRFLKKTVAASSAFDEG